MGVMPPGLGAVRAERAPAGCDIARNADGGRLMAKYSTLDALATGEGVAMLGSVARLPKATASVYCGANGLERGRGRGALSPGADSARCRCAEAQMGAGAGGCFCLIVSGRKADSAAVALRRNMISSTEEAASCGGGMAKRFVQNGRLNFRLNRRARFSELFRVLCRHSAIRDVTTITLYQSATYV